MTNLLFDSDKSEPKYIADLDSMLGPRQSPKTLRFVHNSVYGQHRVTQSMSKLFKGFDTKQLLPMTELSKLTKSRLKSAFS